MRCVKKNEFLQLTQWNYRHEPAATGTENESEWKEQQDYSKCTKHDKHLHTVLLHANCIHAIDDSHGHPKCCRQMHTHACAQCPSLFLLSSPSPLRSPAALCTCMHPPALHFLMCNPIPFFRCTAQRGRKGGWGRYFRSFSSISQFPSPSHPSGIAWVCRNPLREHAIKGGGNTERTVRSMCNRSREDNESQ